MKLLVIYIKVFKFPPGEFNSKHSILRNIKNKNINYSIRDIKKIILLQRDGIVHGVGRIVLPAKILRQWRPFISRVKSRRITTPSLIHLRVSKSSLSSQRHLPFPCFRTRVVSGLNSFPQSQAIRRT